jgi:hypothetical protein
MKIGHLRLISKADKSQLKVESISRSDNEKDDREELEKRLQDVERRYKKKIEDDQMLKLYTSAGKEISYILPACKLKSLLV